MKVTIIAEINYIFFLHCRTENIFKIGQSQTNVQGGSTEMDMCFECFHSLKNSSQIISHKFVQINTDVLKIRKMLKY